MLFTVKTEKFEGPLDLLLDLIEKRKFFINDVSLSKVADEYIEHIKKFERFPIGESADFILIASTLLLIKSKSLLPSLTLTDDEKGSIEDLEKRLNIYKKIKDASLMLAPLFGKNVLFGAESRKLEPVFAPDDSMNIVNLLEAVKRVLQALPKKEVLPQTIVKKVISLEEMIDSLTERVQKSLKMSFREFSSSHKAERVNVIVSFLAMLELVKEGIIHVSQEKHFDDIQMETHDVSVPRYG
ncbi:MAG: segregation/condensation protein A [Candidatus Taylorbacteria bacterium]|nr:segregation/condensation protein A [Candidatus Taylorbacteria bacterium]